MSSTCRICPSEPSSPCGVGYSSTRGGPACKVAPFRGSSWRRSPLRSGGEEIVEKRLHGGARPRGAPYADHAGTDTAGRINDVVCRETLGPVQPGHGPGAVQEHGERVAVILAVLRHRGLVLHHVHGHDLETLSPQLRVE